MGKKKYFQDKVILITGASSGIGQSAALTLAKMRAKVVIASRNYEKLKELETQIQAVGYQALAVRADVSNAEDVNALVDSVIQHWGRIDVLISNAGEYFRGSILETANEIFRKSFDVNFFGSLYTIKRVLPLMLDQKSGCIVLMNTLDSKKGVVGDGPYVSAKAALDGLGDVLRQELSGTGVRVISVYPGRVDTPMIKDIEVPWITPKISPNTVVKRMTQGIVKSKPIVVVPHVYFSLGALNNLFPRFMDWAYRLLRLQGLERKIRES